MAKLCQGKNGVFSRNLTALHLRATITVFPLRMKMSKCAWKKDVLMGISATFWPVAGLAL
jgi:hypothetical protein